MGGGLMQLVAYGAQDVYLTGDPQITYFKVVYRRHTNFSMECIQQTFNGTPGANKKVSTTISRNGDLIGAMHIAVPDIAITVDANGSGVLDAQKQSTARQVGTFQDYVDEVTVEIGGQQIDKHYGKWLDIWYDLSTNLQNKPKSTLFTDPWHGTAAVATTPASTHKIAAGGFGYSYIPLQFWFNRNAGLALPLIALQYHEVKLTIKFATTEPTGSKRDLTKAQLWVDYFYLDTEERKRFAQMSHEYLIDQLQFTGSENLTAAGDKFRLNFNHPVKELVWETQTNHLDGTVKLQLNGHDRFAERNFKYFTRLQKYYHHTNVPTGGSSNVGVYSFALRPEEHQPSGTCNFSRIDNATLVSGSAGGAGTIDIYAVNYNVLRVVSGMGGLAYSN